MNLYDHNDDYKQALRDREFLFNLKLMKEYRDTMYPVIDEDEDDLNTKVILRLSIRS